jgi:hypothetical protein
MTEAIRASRAAKERHEIPAIMFRKRYFTKMMTGGFSDTKVVTYIVCALAQPAHGAGAFHANCSG